VLYTGSSYGDCQVSIGAPDLDAVGAVAKSSDVAGVVEEWLAEAKRRDDIVYFSIRLGEKLVGQIFLHDTDETRGEALVGYHLFEEKYRDRGVGTAALGLLQEYVKEKTGLSRLVVITGAENKRSRRIAEKCGFVEVGVSREDIELVVYQWCVR
jgi:RimJ/RimL family protein N-acetyltransferase